MESEELKRIKAEKEELLLKVSELRQREYELENKEDLEYADSVIGKCFIGKGTGTGCTKIFKAKKKNVDKYGHVTIVGASYESQLFLIGSKMVSVFTDEGKSVSDFTKEYEEISEEEFNELRTEIFYDI